jgi:hypothetical protein
VIFRPLFRNAARRRCARKVAEDRGRDGAIGFEVTRVPAPALAGLLWAPLARQKRIPGPGIAFAPDFELKPSPERLDHTHTDTMQSAGDFVPGPNFRRRSRRRPVADMPLLREYRLNAGAAISMTVTELSS